MLAALNYAFLQELQEIKSSYYKLFLVTLLPLISVAILVAIFFRGVAFDLPIVVVDKDRSDLSRHLLHGVDATSTLSIAYRVNDTKEALSLIQRSKAYALVEVPQGFKRDILLQKQPKVTIMLNTQYILTGKIIKAALMESIMSASGEIEYLKNLVTTQNSYESINAITPIGLQVTPFFNTYKNYSYFLLSALLPSIWQIFIVIATIVSFGTLFKEKRAEAFFKDGDIEMKIVGKALPYTIIYTLLGIAFLAFLYGSEGWVFQGSWAVMLCSIFITVVAYQAIALFLFVTGFDYARSLSLGAVYTAPAFAFLGVTFPANSMNSFALLWRDLLPIAHYMEIQISQANYGVDIFVELPRLFSIALFLLLLLPVFYRFRVKLIQNKG